MSDPHSAQAANHAGADGRGVYPEAAKLRQTRLRISPYRVPGNNASAIGRSAKQSDLVSRICGIDLQKAPLALPTNLFGRQPQMKPSIVLGPHLVRTPKPAMSPPDIAPLGFAIEWASPVGARRILLFRHSPAHAPNRLRLENLVVAANQLPFDVECPEYQRVGTRKKIFVPLESLLLSLYRTHDVARPVCDLLRELASCVQLHSTVTSPILTTGLLANAIEERGFRLNTLVPSSCQLIADIAWNPPGADHRFHVCLCAFGASQEDGEWMKPGLIGVSQLLSDELRQIIQGPPAALFSPEGVRLLSAKFDGVPFLCDAAAG